jgi:hypothetical protein
MKGYCTFVAMVPEDEISKLSGELLILEIENVLIVR